MDRLKPELLKSEPPYIPSNVTAGEFIDRIEPLIGRDNARRLRLLADLHDVMPD